MIARALNQKTARDLPFEAFLDLAAGLGCVGVEPRNDLGRPLFDGIAPAHAAEMARTRGLRFLGLSEVYGFNVWDDERATQIQALIDIAEAAGAETISLIPSVDARPTRPLRDVMRDILPMVAGRAVLPLIEPIGFETSTLPRKAELVDAIEAVGGVGAFKLVHDTFQHVIAGESELFPHHTGIVHISGISDPDVALDARQDGHRGLICRDDRCDNRGQVRRFLAEGYEGAFSFECTEPGLIAAPDSADIDASFNWLSA
ncbi:TIM barrel protein [Defluviimonas sp. SAOS-178_SWC]|uniref:TIM barrel protein n=1 Tax=Defluviimonas sp. SAOS-178_SWC TaxID=3121287 RepID=UPI003221D31E